MFNLNLKNKTMKAKTIMAFLFTVLSVTLLVTMVSAASLNFNEIEVDGIDVDLNSLVGVVAVTAGDAIPVSIEFTSLANAKGPVEISAWIQGAKSETEVTKFMNVNLIENKTYGSKFTVIIPADLDDNDKIMRDLTLVIRVESDDGSEEIKVKLAGQRESDKLSVLLIDMDNPVAPGTIVPVNMVIRNMGSNVADNVFVTVSIPELGISKTAFFEDLFPVDNCDVDDDFEIVCRDRDDDNEDSKERRVFLTIPTNAKPGVYQVEVVAKSDDSRTTVLKSLTVMKNPVSSKALANPVSKSFSLGETVSYEMILVNTGKEIAIYNLVADSSDALSISLSDTLTTVPAGSSKSVKVTVKANREGTHTFAVNAISEGYAETAVYTANVEGKSSPSVVGGSNNVVVLTVVLAIIFVVLLIVLIVLLTRKPEKSEEFGESYY